MTYDLIFSLFQKPFESICFNSRLLLALRATTNPKPGIKQASWHGKVHLVLVLKDTEMSDGLPCHCSVCDLPARAVPHHRHCGFNNAYTQPSKERERQIDGLADPTDEKCMHARTQIMHTYIHKANAHTYCASIQT